MLKYFSGMYFLSGPACCSRRVFLRVYDFKVLSNAFYFLFYSVCDDSPSARLPPALSQYFLSCWSFLFSVVTLLSLLYLTFSLSLLPHFSRRLLARTCVHHRRIPATCYLITRARATLKTSLAERIPGEALKVRVMQPKPTIQQKLSSTVRSVRNWY